MIAGLDPKELIELALLLIAVGALSGFLAGIFGIGGGAAVAGAGHLEARRRRAEGLSDARLRLFCRAVVDLDGRRRRPVREPADDLLWPADPPGGRDLVGDCGPDLNSRRNRLCLCR